MAPILLDNRGIIKFGVTAVIVTLLAFSGGFLFGYHQAKDQNVRSTASEPLSLPVIETQLATDVAQQIPEVVEAGEVIDVDQPETATVAIVPAKQALVSTDAPEIQTADVSTKKIPDEVVSLATVDDEIASKDITNSELIPVTDDVTTKAKYSIQVGMYGRLANAEAMAEKLRLQNLHAYITDYINKKNEVRFNVKFGYFPDKKVASAALNDYIDIQNGDGYLVSFTVDYLTHTEAASSAVELDKELDLYVDDSLTKKNGSDTKAITTAPEIISETQLKSSEAKLAEEADKLIYN